MLGAPDDDCRTSSPSYDVDRVIVAYSRDRHEDLVELIRELRGCPVQIDVVPRLFDAVAPERPSTRSRACRCIGLTPARIPRSSRLLKRAIDVVGASLLLLLRCR